MPDTDKMPDVVYHYTSMDTLTKIVTNKHLWATSIFFLNDISERELFLTLAEERIPALLSELDGIVLPLHLHKTSEVSYAPFVTSFASQSDSLLHWRAYCPQQNGVAIGFRTACLAEARIDQKSEPGMLIPGCMFSPIRYIGPDSTSDIDHALRFTYKHAATYFADNKAFVNEHKLDFTEFFSLTLEGVASLFKHEAFEVEREYRLVLEDVRSRDDAMHFRTTRSTLVPYVPLRIPSLKDVQLLTGRAQATHPFWDAISSVTIGPTVNLPLSTLAMEAFFTSKGMNIEIRQSKVPYRDW